MKRALPVTVVLISENLSKGKLINVELFIYVEKKGRITKANSCTCSYFNYVDRKAVNFNGHSVRHPVR
jgi:hypothetical protein